MTTTLLVNSYPFYAATDVDDLGTPSPVPDLSVPQSLISAVEATGAVIQDNNGFFQIAQGKLNQAVPDPHAQLSVLNAVNAANDAIRAEKDATKVSALAANAANPPNPVTIITTILGNVPNIQKIQADLTALAAGAKVVFRHWWGVKIALTKAAATALADLVGTQLGNLSAVMTALAAIPGLTVLGAIASVFSAVLKLLSGIITQANSGANGITILLALWFLPFIKSAP